MKKFLQQISVTTTLEAEEAVLALMERVFALPAAAYFDERTKKSLVSVYCSKHSEWNLARREAIEAGLEGLKGAHPRTAPRNAAFTRQKVRIGLSLPPKGSVPIPLPARITGNVKMRSLNADGINVGSGKISFKLLARENWAESWKEHFKPIEVGEALLLKPSWSRHRPRKGQAVVVLDPGLSFGTGQHPTTEFCLRQLVRCRRRGQAQAFLDIGTGSGILAIAAAKLGYAPVEAFDFDPESVRVARQNAKQNRILNRLRIHRADLTKLPSRSRERYDFICANLISTLLLAECGRIAGRLRRGGVLVLAGILKSEFVQVQKAYERFGLQFMGGRCDKEWHSGAFVFRG